MEIIVYTKEGCKLCVGLKDKFVNHLKVEFAVRDLDDALLQCESWREDGTIAVNSAHAMIDEQVPLVLIDGVPFDYIKALAHVKARLKAGEKATMPQKAPGDGKNLSSRIGPLTEAQFVERLRVICDRQLDVVLITSKATRRYDGRATKRWSLDVSGDIQVHVRIQDARQVVLKLFVFTINASDFGDALFQAELKMRAGRAEGNVQ